VRRQSLSPARMHRDRAGRTSPLNTPLRPVCAVASDRLRGGVGPARNRLDRMSVMPGRGGVGRNFAHWACASRALLSHYMSPSHANGAVYTQMRCALSGSVPTIVGRLQGYDSDSSASRRASGLRALLLLCSSTGMRRRLGHAAVCRAFVVGQVLTAQCNCIDPAHRARIGTRKAEAEARPRDSAVMVYLRLFKPSTPTPRRRRCRICCKALSIVVGGVRPGSVEARDSEIGPRWATAHRSGVRQLPPRTTLRRGGGSARLRRSDAAVHAVEDPTQACDRLSPGPRRWSSELTCGAQWRKSHCNAAASMTARSQSGVATPRRPRLCDAVAP